jgi:hypothetical protein
MRTRTDAAAISDLVDQVAALDDAPDRTVYPWFYADLARLAADTIDDHLLQELPDDRAVSVGMRRHGRTHRGGAA